MALQPSIANLAIPQCDSTLSLQAEATFSRRSLLSGATSYGLGAARPYQIEPSIRTDGANAESAFRATIFGGRPPIPRESITLPTGTLLNAAWYDKSPKQSQKSAPCE